MKSSLSRIHRIFFRFTIGLTSQRVPHEFIALGPATLKGGNVLVVLVLWEVLEVAIYEEFKVILGLESFTTKFFFEFWEEVVI
jgi:hypothetical protein